jgi:hypothetical protein
LKELNVDGEVISEIGNLLEPLRKEIVFTSSLFERIGGEKAIEAAVGIFYKKMLADPRVARFFKTVDIKKKKEK